MRYVNWIFGLVGLIALIGAAYEASPASLDDIQKMARESDCAKYEFRQRGRTPRGYIEGVTLTFARAVCEQDRADVKVVSSARQLPESVHDRQDALSWYNSNFRALEMSNDVSGVDTLRHAYALLIGLGMRESSGRHCCGRDMSANFSSSSSAEAGLFQASWGSAKWNSVLEPMFRDYLKNPKGCFREVFSKGVTCSTSNWKNWGSGDGFNWQKLSKECPAFATEWTAVLLRSHGGTKGEFGPLRTKAAEIKPQCDRLLSAVQTLTLSDPEYCRLLSRK